MTRNHSAELLAHRTSTALAIVAALTGATSFFYWRLFQYDLPSAVGNLRGTALTLLVVALPLLVASMHFAARGSLRAQFVWLGSLAYIAYNAVLFCFAAHFNPFFLLYTTMLALSFWAIVTLTRAMDLEAVRAATSGVPARTVTIYLLLCNAAFALLWLTAIVPAVIHNDMPEAITTLGLTQNPIWVLDFAFTFPFMAVGGIWLWRRRPWGFVIGGMMVIMLTIETLSIAVDQWFGHLHDPSVPAAALPAMLFLTAAGLFFSILFLRRMHGEGGTEGHFSSDFTLRRSSF